MRRRPPRRPRLRPLDQRGGERLRVELAEVLARLADADVADRDPQLLRDGDHDAAFGGAVELGEDQPGDPDRLLELARLGERVLALVGIEHQQHLVRGGGVHAREHAPDLLQLFHQVRLAVQAPGGIGEQHVAAAGLGRLQRIEHHRAGVGAGLLRGEGGAGALGPHLQLLDRGGAEGVAGGQQHAQALAGHSGAASLPMVVVLPEPFTPTTRITNGRRLASITSGWAQGARICDDARAQRARSAPPRR